MLFKAQSVIKRFLEMGSLYVKRIYLLHFQKVRSYLFLFTVHGQLQLIEVGVVENVKLSSNPSCVILSRIVIRKLMICQIISNFAELQF